VSPPPIQRIEEHKSVVEFSSTTNLPSLASKALNAPIVNVSSSDPPGKGSSLSHPINIDAIDDDMLDLIHQAKGYKITVRANGSKVAIRPKAPQPKCAGFCALVGNNPGMLALSKMR
jgi:hypothetical protein